MPAPVLLCPLIPLGIGAIFWVIGRLLAGQVRGWVRTQGRVVPGEGWNRRFVNVAYYDPHGNVLVAQARHGVQPWHMFPGTVVPVVFDPAAPARARLDNGEGNGTAYVVIAWILVTLAVLAEAVLLAVYVRF